MKQYSQGTVENSRSSPQLADLDSWVWSGKETIKDSPAQTSHPKVTVGIPVSALPEESNLKHNTARMGGEARGRVRSENRL